MDSIAKDIHQKCIEIRLSKELYLGKGKRKDLNIWVSPIGQLAIWEKEATPRIGLSLLRVKIFCMVQSGIGKWCMKAGILKDITFRCVVGNGFIDLTNCS